MIRHIHGMAERSNGELFIFRWEPGCEPDVAAKIIEFVDDPEVQLDHATAMWLTVRLALDVVDCLGEIEFGSPQHSG